MDFAPVLDGRKFFVLPEKFGKRERIGKTAPDGDFPKFQIGLTQKFFHKKQSLIMNELPGRKGGFRFEQAPERVDGHIHASGKIPDQKVIPEFLRDPLDAEHDPRIQIFPFGNKILPVDQNQILEDHTLQEQLFAEILFFRSKSAKGLAQDRRWEDIKFACQ